ncbi:MAG: AAA family ATPase [Bdellovibrionales bacterium]|nr:AAA family ATPase [Bdellovibrionales bacterium]
MATNELSDLSNEQAHALEYLQSGENIFLTGGAGSGKSYVIRDFLGTLNSEYFPVLASTGAVAVLVGGRTFHSFFGLGIMEGGPEATLDRALRDSRLLKRLRLVEGIIIDEVSMIPGAALTVAETLTQKARGSRLPWGGLRIIAVGDFLQLPPVTRTGERDWCFLQPVWEQTGFQNCVLTQNQRVNDSCFIEILNKIRVGEISEPVQEFLNAHLEDHDQTASGTRLYPRRDQSELFNLKKLDEINQPPIELEAIYFGESKYVEILKKTSPAASRLVLKAGCEVLFVQNDPQKRWVNGTRGYVTEIEGEKVKVHKEKGRTVTVERSLFVYQDADGQVLASVLQFPLVLAYATTIHKSQGATLDEIWCDLGALWEPGHAYVALSRLRSSRGLHLLRWNSRSIRLDPAVLKFYQELPST